ncbi:MAG: hypothetical protein WCS94_03525 [Verrucomicrobiota bacterium]
MWKKNENPGDILSKYIPKDFDQNRIEDTANIKRPYYYMILYLAYEQSEDIVGLSRECVKILHTHSGLVHTLISTFAFVSFEGNTPQISQFRANESLIEKFKEKIKVVYGKTETCYANLGYETTLRYSLVLPHFDKALKLLTAIENGKSVQCDL